MQIIILLVGVLLVIIGFYFHNKHRNLVRLCTMQALGTVIRMDRREEVNTETDDDGHTRKSTTIMYYPVFQYTAGDRNIEKISSSGSSRPQFSEGQTVTVMYEPANAERYYVVEDKTAGRFGVYLMVFGAVVFVIGLVIQF